MHMTDNQRHTADSHANSLENRTLVPIASVSDIHRSLCSRGHYVVSAAPCPRCRIDIKHELSSIRGKR